jgi:hypothetical protein
VYWRDRSYRTWTSSLNIRCTCSLRITRVNCSYLYWWTFKYRFRFIWWSKDKVINWKSKWVLRKSWLICKVAWCDDNIGLNKRRWMQHWSIKQTLRIFRRFRLKGKPNNFNIRFCKYSFKTSNRNFSHC